MNAEQNSMLKKSDEVVVGKAFDRVDGRAKVTGKAKYAAEFPASNMAHAVLVSSAIAKGKIADINTQAAERVPGVLAVITHLNAPKIDGRPKNGGDRNLLLLQDNTVRYNRQHIAVVVAESLEAARHAAALVEVKYEAEHPAVVLEEKLDEAYMPQSSLPRNEGVDSAKGAFDRALASADVKFEQTYKTPVENHNPMEPHATTAIWTDDKHLTVYDASQGIFGARRRLASIFNLPVDNVRVITKFVGGGFGCKGSTWSHVPLAVMAAQVVKRPVKLALEREQMFGSVGYRPRTIQKIRLGATRDGRLLALSHEGVSQTSTFDEFIEPVAKSARMLYAAQSINTEHRLVKLDVGTPTFMRAPGESSGSFALESAMDELAYELKIDPIELRLKNYAETDPTSKLPFSSKSLRQCYEQGAARFGWSRRNPAPRSMRDGRFLVGMGMSTATYPTNRSAATAFVRISDDGRVLVQCGSQDLGTGTYTIMTQIAADALGVPVEMVRFDLGDTTLPDSPVSGGSQTAASVGSAVKAACDEARRKVAQLAVADSASPLYGATVENISMRDGKMFRVGDGAKSESYISILKRNKLPAIEAKASAAPGDERKRFSMHSFGAQFCEVRVDEDLGVVRLARWTGVFGVGRVLNAKTAVSQLRGGIVYGIGMALTEETVTDARQGRVVNANLAEYHVPVNLDVPPIEIYFVDEVDPYINPIGAKGIGEIGITGVAAAIANAIYHATGKRVRELPITLDKLL
jgi:xanthine dehydrogenase YagR molybdenum-binding subunit